jgi:hypothetical protein
VVVGYKLLATQNNKSKLYLRQEGHVDFVLLVGERECRGGKHFRNWWGNALKNVLNQWIVDFGEHAWVFGRI